MPSLDYGSSLSSDLAKSQLEEARVSLEAARDDLKAGRYARAVFDAQQCVELAMKATLTMYGISQLIAHDVVPYFASEVVTRVPEEWVESFREIVRTTAWLFEHYTLTRYPMIRGRKIWRPSKEYRREQGEEAIECSEKAMEVITRFLREEFKLSL